MTSQGDVLGGLKGLVWVQPGGPNTEMYPLACHEMGDVTQPHETVTQRYCPDPRRPGKYRPVYKASEAPGRAGGSLTTYLERTADWLEKIADVGCETPIYLNLWVDGRGTAFSTYTRGELSLARIEQESRTGMMTRESDPAAEQTFTYTADEIFKYFKLIRSEQLLALVAPEPGDALDIAFVNRQSCRAAGGIAAEECTEGIIGCEVEAAADAGVYYTLNGGATWTLCAAVPFANPSNSGAVAGFPIDTGVNRYLVGRTSTLAATLPQIAYSDDHGANWTVVDLPGTVIEYLQGGAALWALDSTHIWCVTDGGDIFFSDDGGESYTQQASANVAALWCIHFRDERYGLLGGATNVMYSSADGGEHWSVVTGPVAQNAVTILSCCVIDDMDWWIGYADGTLWFTQDGGATWTQRLFTVPGAASVNVVNDIQFENAYFGAVAVNWTDGAGDEWGAILRTVNGGRNWEVYLANTSFDEAAAPGYNGLWLCDRNKVYAVGDIIDAVASVHVFSGNF